MKKTWKGIKQIVSIKSQMNNVPTKIKKEQIEITDSDQIANAFNEYFANIGTGFADEIPKVDKSPFDYLTSRLTESFYISPVSTFEIEEEITRLHCNKSSDLELVLNVELQKVHIWLCSNKLSLNVNKSNFVIFHSSQKKQTSTVTLTINIEILQEEKCVKYLVIYIDSNLNWRNQVNYIKKKVNRSIGILSKIRYYVNINTLINLYYSLVHPFLIYGFIIYMTKLLQSDWLRGVQLFH